MKESHPCSGTLSKGVIMPIKISQTLLMAIAVQFLFATPVAAFDLGENLVLRIQIRTNGKIRIVNGAPLTDIKNAFVIDSMQHSFRNAPYSFAFYDSLSSPVNGNFSLADSTMFVVDFRTNKSGFYRIIPSLCNALNAAISDSSFAMTRTIFVPDSSGQQRALVISFHYKGFIEADLASFNEKAGFGKYRLYFPSDVSESALRNELIAVGVQFAQ
jgi:hypothetical protein